MIAGFTRFAAIDWSGAKGCRHKGIAIALCEAGEGSPALARPGHVWSRTEVLDWLLAEAAAAPTLFGFDFSFAPPILARGDYLPGEGGVPREAKAFWAYVDARCADDDLGAASFLEASHRRHFYFGAADGLKRDFLHHRLCEKTFNAAGGGKASTVYDAIGAAQVAKASFAGMRLLHHLKGRVPIWPMDDRPRAGSLVVEIYTRVFLRMAGLSGSKVRTREALDRALVALSSRPSSLDRPPTDHESDALIAAAALRRIARHARYWNPAPLDGQTARGEGWTFGVTSP